MTVHLRDAGDLGQVDVLAVTERNDLIKVAEQLERVPVNLTSICGSADRGYDARYQLKGIDVYINP